MGLLSYLNEQQREAVTHAEGPLLVLAGAGSGKTRVITSRAAYLVEGKKVRPENILAITFTNKAAREMKERIGKMLGNTADDMWVGTFHYTCVKILRKDIEKIGYTRSFVIFDTDDQRAVVKDCLKELRLNEDNFNIREVLSAIGRAKDELIEPEDYAKTCGSDYRSQKMADIYRLYQVKLKKNNALDFDDIILAAIKLLRNNPPVLRHYQEKFRYVMVDEFQDTNTAQSILIDLLAGKYKNMCVVGDDDQSIYGWRGANMWNILDFEKNYPGCRVIKLEKNYRSTQSILDAANSVIKNNRNRKAKKLWTENQRGESVQILKGESEREEAYIIAREIRRLVDAKNRNYRDFAVLYRINAQSRVLEDEFRREGIPYKIFGGLRFYDRKEIKDIIAYLRLVQYTADDIALKRIINVPRRGIGSATLEAAEKVAAQTGSDIFSVIASSHKYPELKRAAAKLQKFADLILWLRRFKEEGVYKLIEEVIEKSGIQEEIQAEDDEAESRLENIKELLSDALEFERRCAESNEECNLEQYLANVSLVSDIDNLEEEKDYAVLMTLHSAKGLEFPVVFMAGMENGVFPGIRSMCSESEMEEERRLCYVGITRAKEKLYMTYASKRTLLGKTSFNDVSQFLKEIHDKRDIQNKTCDKSFSLKVGDSVVHRKFGVGVITAVEKENDDFVLDINFKNAGMKRLMAAFANLVKL